MGGYNPTWRQAAAAVVVGLGLAVPAEAQQPQSEPINLRRTVTVDVVRRTENAIVNIATTTRQFQRRMGFDPFGDPFGGPFGQVVQVPVNSLGSGFILHPDGYVVTNNHVIDKAREVTVELMDGRKVRAGLVSADPENDLAILKIEADDPLPALELGDSDDLMIGEPAIAVGNPLGFSHSVSTGIVAAVHRDLKGAQENVVLSDLIQTDAAINPGNSGGPLLNAYGQVIGINTAIRGDAQNIGFAIPVNRLRDLVPALMNPALASKTDVGIRLTEVRKSTPPAHVNAEVHIAGQETGPSVVTVANRPVKNIVDAYAALLTVRPDQEQIHIGLSDGSQRTVPVRAVPLPDAIVQAKRQLGMTVEEVTPMAAERYGLKIDRGLLVTEVRRGSVADKAGVQAGDVILGLGLYPIANLSDLAKLIPHLPARGQVRMTVVRGDQVGYGVLKFPG